MHRYVDLTPIRHFCYLLAMPPRKQKMKDSQGNEFDAIILPFQAGVEHWNEYLVDDGSVIRIKLVVTEVLRLEGQYDPATGDPIYIAKSQNIVNVSSPENLKKGAQNG